MLRQAKIHNWASPRKSWVLHREDNGELGSPQKAIDFLSEMRIGSKLLLVEFNADDALWRGRPTRGQFLYAPRKIIRSSQLTEVRQMEFISMNDWTPISIPSLLPQYEDRLSAELNTDMSVKVAN